MTKEKTNRKLRVFIASPGDVREERDIISLVVAEIRRMFEQVLPIQLDAIRWETHAWPDIGEDAQDVINREIGEYDIFVGVMWTRFGTPTKRARSGTDEEFQRAYEYFKKYKRPKVMFYFRRTPFYTTDLKELSQFRRVVQFRKELEKLGVLFWEYDNPIDFERFVREHLIRHVMDLSQIETIEKPSLDNIVSPKRVSSKCPSLSLLPISSLSIPKPTIFIAYSHEDMREVAKIYEDLRIGGFNPWLDTENLRPGQMWHAEIESAIAKSEFIVICLSSKSVSKRGYFQNELKVAIDASLSKKESEQFLIPVRLDQVELPEPLRMMQCLDYFLPNGPERLVATLREAKSKNKEKWRT